MSSDPLNALKGSQDLEPTENLRVSSFSKSNLDKKYYSFFHNGKRNEIRHQYCSICKNYKF